MFNAPKAIVLRQIHDRSQELEAYVHATHSYRIASIGSRKAALRAG